MQAKDPANHGLEQGGSINVEKSEAHSGIPRENHIDLPTFKGMTDIVMTHLSSVLNNANA